MFEFKNDFRYGISLSMYDYQFVRVPDMFFIDVISITFL